ncbi:MAG: hypothetical protein FJ202_09415 [Gemmatimonadetes bacterium]|nr:hypothetical protein [Gemmatimonadota bacterium]
MTGAAGSRTSGQTIARIFAIGAAVGLAGLGLFAGLHALVIKPIWSELAQGIPFVIAIGVSVTWAYHEYVKTVPQAVCSTGGLRFGAMIWLSALPATALASIMRARAMSADASVGMSPGASGGSLPAWVDVASVVLALAGGALVIGVVTRSRRAAGAAAVAAGVLLAAGGGPLPILRGGRVAELWFGLFVLECLGGVVLAQLYRRFMNPGTVPREAASAT